MFSPAALRTLALSLNGAEETYPFGPETRVFTVGGKIFALDNGPAQDAPALDRRTAPPPFTVSLKGRPEDVAVLTTVPGIRGGYHLNKRHWVTVDLDGAVPDALVEELVAQSHGLVVAGLPKARRLLLGDSI